MNFWIPYRCGSFFSRRGKLASQGLWDVSLCLAEDSDPSYSYIMVGWLAEWLVGWFTQPIFLSCRLLKDLACRRNRKKRREREIMKRRKLDSVNSKT